MIKSAKYFIQSLIIIIFFIFARLIGLNLSRKIFSRIFLKLAPIFKSRKIINENLIKFKKDISDNEKKEIISEMWRNYGKTFIEYIFLNYLRNNSSHIKFIGEDNIKEIAQNKKQAIFISGHFANFELMSMELTKKGINLATIYRPLNNFLNPLMEYLRKKYICKNQIKKGIKGVRDTIEYINKDFSIALMIDQRVSEGEKIDFFNKPAFTTTLPAQLSKKFNLPIIPVSIKRSNDDLFVVKFFKEINPDQYKDKIELSKKLNSILELMIQDNPGQWIWTHNRWK